MINNALDRIRLIVMQKYNQKTDNLEDNNPFYYVLKKFKYYLLKEYDDLSKAYELKFVKVPLDDRVDKYYSDETNHEKYEEIISGDDLKYSINHPK